MPLKVVKKLDKKAEIFQNLSIQAQKLAILLYYSTMPDDVKESWLAVIPEMSLSQIDRLLNILEAKYIDEQTKDIDEKYAKKIKKVVENFDKKRIEDKENLLKKINELIK